MKTTRNTTAKTAVLEIFGKSKTALSHTEIYKQIENLCDRVTVYRILDRLVNDDIVHKIVIIMHNGFTLIITLISAVKNVWR